LRPKTADFSDAADAMHEDAVHESASAPAGWRRCENEIFDRSARIRWRGAE
jgi:hypothetical protein